MFTWAFNVDVLITIFTECVVLTTNKGQRHLVHIVFLCRYGPTPNTVPYYN